MARAKTHGESRACEEDAAAQSELCIQDEDERGQYSRRGQGRKRKGSEEEAVRLKAQQLGG